MIQIVKAISLWIANFPDFNRMIINKFKKSQTLNREQYTKKILRASRLHLQVSPVFFSIADATMIISLQKKKLKELFRK